MKRFIGRMLIGFVVLILATGNLAARAQESDPEPWLDLAAMHLYPDDLEAVNFPGYGLFFNAGTDFPEQTAVDFATDDRDVDETFAEHRRMGLRRAHRMKVSLPTEPGDPSSAEHRFVNTWVAEFEESGPRMDEAWEEFKGMFLGEERQGTRTIGEDSLVARMTTVDYRDVTFEAMTITIRIDRVIAAVVLADSTGRQPLTSQVETLAERLVSRIERGLNGDTPNLYARSLSFQGTYVFNWYLAMNGDGVRLYGFSDEETDGTAVHPDGSLDVFEQHIEFARGDVNRYDDDGILGVILYRFEDVDSAQRWFDSAPDRIEKRFPEYEQYDVADLGDEAFGVTYTAPSSSNSGETDYSRRITVRSGAYVIDLRVQDLRPVAAPPVEEIMGWQIDCLSDGGCEESRAEPHSLFAER